MSPDSPFCATWKMVTRASRAAPGEPLAKTRSVPARSVTNMRPSGAKARSQGTISPDWITVSARVGPFPGSAVASALAVGRGDGGTVAAGPVVAGGGRGPEVTVGAAGGGAVLTPPVGASGLLGVATETAAGVPPQAAASTSSVTQADHPEERTTASYGRAITL